jgi:hypothetical protein
MAENGILDYQGMNQAIYRGATSNIIVDTQSMSIEIGAGNSSHTSNLHIECDHDANVASIQLNSNVVTEFSRSKKLIKYPRVALTQDDESSTTGYVADASTEESINTGPWKAFNGDGGAWETTPKKFNNTSGDWDGTTTAPYAISLVGGTTIYGEWVELKIPNKIQLHTCRIAPMTHSTYTNLGRHRSPRNGYILGRVGATGNWTVLKSWSDVIHGWEDLVLRDFDIENPSEYYDYFRVVWTAINGNTNYSTSAGAGYASSGEIEFLGVPEYDPEAHGTDVTVKSVANVPNTDWLEVYYDAKDLTSISGMVADLSGKSVTGTLNGDVSIDTLNDVKSFSFDGSGDYISGTLTNTGDFDFTVSTWVYETNGTTTNTIWMIGSGSGNSNPNPSVALAVDSAGSLDFFVFSGTEIRMSNFRDTFGINKWHHIVCTRTGTALKYFINGIDQNRPASANLDPLSIAANSIFNIGARTGNQLGNNPMHGKIANFRLFNRTLTSDEIYQLYAYQKEYFGHDVLGMTLKAGRLGIGTSEPRAALDVRGDIHGGMPVFFDVRFTSAPTANWLGTQIVFDTINNSRGGGFDTSTGTFTAPIAGQYKFSYFMRGNIANQSFKIKPRINGLPSFTTVDNGVNDGTNANLLGTAFCGGDGIQGSAVCIVKLEAGGTFELMLSSHGTLYTSALANFYNGFTGEYISSL